LTPEPLIRELVKPLLQQELDVPDFLSLHGIDYTEARMSMSGRRHRNGQPKKVAGRCFATKQEPDASKVVYSIYLYPDLDSYSKWLVTGHELGHIFIWKNQFDKEEIPRLPEEPSDELEYFCDYFGERFVEAIPNPTPGYLISKIQD
jgi:hypothetical protein